MGRYIIQRTFLMIPTLIVVSLIVFSLVRIMPGDVVLKQLESAPSYDPALVDELRHELGLDRPFVQQYVSWLGQAITGDLGDSLFQRGDVREAILSRLPLTFSLAIIAFIIANIIAFIFGVTSALYQDSWVDYVVRLISIGGLSVPQFWIGTLVIVFGSRYLGYFPPLNYIPIERDPVGNFLQLIIPAVIISFGSSAALMRLIRSTMLEVLRQDYIRTARSKGLSNSAVLYRHALRNALAPVITLQGIQLNILLTGSLVIEIIFNLPGVGRLAFDAINERDYTMVQGIALIFGTLFALSNLIIDIMYGLLDPRIQY